MEVDVGNAVQCRLLTAESEVMEASCLDQRTLAK